MRGPSEKPAVLIRQHVLNGLLRLHKKTPHLLAAVVMARRLDGEGAALRQAARLERALEGGDQRPRDRPPRIPHAQGGRGERRGARAIRRAHEDVQPLLLAAGGRHRGGALLAAARHPGARVGVHVEGAHAPVPERRGVGATPRPWRASGTASSSRRAWPTRRRAAPSSRRARPAPPLLPHRRPSGPRSSCSRGCSRRAPRGSRSCRRSTAIYGVKCTQTDENRQKVNNPVLTAMFDRYRAATLSTSRPTRAATSRRCATPSRAPSSRSSRRSASRACSRASRSSCSPPSTTTCTPSSSPRRTRRSRPPTSSRRRPSARDVLAPLTQGMRVDMGRRIVVEPAAACHGVWFTALGSQLSTRLRLSQAAWTMSQRSSAAATDGTPAPSSSTSLPQFPASAARSKNAERFRRQRAARGRLRGPSNAGRRPPTHRRTTPSTCASCSARSASTRWRDRRARRRSACRLAVSRSPASKITTR